MTSDVYECRITMYAARCGVCVKLVRAGVDNQDERKLVVGGMMHAIAKDGTKLCGQEDQP